MFEQTKALCQKFLDMGILCFDPVVYKDGRACCGIWATMQLWKKAHIPAVEMNYELSITC